jgi:Tfp pilus assembly PilM family ATPase
MDDDLIGGTRRDPVDAALSVSVDMLVDAIAQSVEDDAANFGSMSQGVSLSGGTALLQGFKTRLQSRLGVPVSIGRPWAEIERSRRNAPFFKDGKVDPRLLVVLSPAIGLALWKERP